MVEIERLKRRGFLSGITLVLGLSGASSGVAGQSGGSIDHVYSACHDNNIRAHNVEDGSVAWSSNIGMALSVAVSPDGSTVYAGNGSGYLYALDAVDGSQLWSVSFGGEFTIIYDIHAGAGGKFIYTADQDGVARCFDLETQQQVWANNLGTAYLFAIASNPEYPFVYAGGEFDQTNLLDKETGERVDWVDWGSDLKAVEAAVDGERSYHGSGAELSVLDPDLSSPSDFVSLASNAEEIATDDETVYVGQSGGDIAAYDTGDLSKKWEATGLHSGRMKGTDVAPDGSRVFTGSFDNTVKALDPADGSVLWSSTAPTDWVNKVAVQTEAPPEPVPRERGPDGLFALWQNYKAMFAALVGGYALIGAWSRSLAIAAWSGYVAFLYMAFKTQTDLFVNIAIVTLVLTVVGFAFKFTRLELTGE